MLARLVNPALLSFAACLSIALGAAGLPGQQAPMAAMAASTPGVQFVPNRGQWHADVRFAAVGDTVGWLHDDGFTLRYERWSEPAARSAAPREQRGGVVRTRIRGAAPRAFTTDGPTGAVRHFLRGSDPTRWHRDVPAFERVCMQQVLPGIDLVFRPLPNGSVGAFEYDLLLAPGVELDRFVARCEGVDELRIDAQGRLCVALPTPDGVVELRQEAPIAWQDTAQGRRPLRVAFRLLDRHTYGFTAVDLDPRAAAVVDPGVVWSTLLGGGATDSVRAVRAVAGTGIWVAGWAGSTDFPTTPGAFRTVGGADGFVARFDERTRALVAATYFGGNASEEIRGLALGPGNTVAVVGYTHSLDFPTTSGAFDTTYSGSSPFLDIGDAFVARLSPDLGTLLASTYLGGIYDDVAEAIDVDVLGNPVVTGWTSSPDWPVTPGCFQGAIGGIPGIQSDGFVVKVAANAQSVLWSTFLGGITAEQLLAVDHEPVSGDVVVAGWSLGGNFPVSSGALRGTPAGSLDGVLTRFAADGSAVVFSTFVGGTANDVLQAVRVDATDGAIWVGGFTESTNFPTTAGAPQVALGGQSDATLVRLPANGAALSFGTLLGGPGAEKLRGIDVSAVGVMVVGEAGLGFPVTPDAPQATFAGGNLDAFATFFANGTTLSWSSYFGGSDQDAFASVQLDAGGLAYVGGWTFSPDPPLTAGAWQSTRRGTEDGLLLQFDVVRSVTGGLVVSDASTASLAFDGAGERTLATATLQNTSERALAVDALRVLLAGAGDAAQQASAVRVRLADPALPGSAVVVGGPLAVVGDDRELVVPLSGCVVPPGSTRVLTVGADLAAVPGELAATLVDADSWTLRAVGAGSGPAVALLGSGHVEGAVQVLSALPTDADGDRLRTVLDVRAIISHVGEPATAGDGDGDGLLTPTDVAIARTAVLGRATILAVPAQFPRGAWTALRGVFLDLQTVQVTLGGVPLRVGRTTPRELVMFVGSAQASGTQRLVVMSGTRVLVDVDVVVP